MRTLREARSAIQNVIDLLVNDGIVLVASSLIEHRRGKSVRLSCERGGMLAALAKLPFASIEEYREYLRGGRYSVVLKDGALLYYSYHFLDEQLVGHSVLYYPVPYDLACEELELFSLEECLDAVSDPIKNIRMRSPIRFDYDESRATEEHPAVHVHLNTAGCRIPVSRPVSPADFTSFIYRSFYLDQWQGSLLSSLHPEPIGSQFINHSFPQVHFRLH